MAILESTTPCATDAQQTALHPVPSPTKFESRRLTVSDCRPWERPFDPRFPSSEPPPSRAPSLRLQGRWLDRAGFAIGSKVRVDVSHGRLVIEALAELPQQVPRLPRRAQKLFF